MILDHDGNVITDQEESYTIKTLNNEVDTLITSLDIAIKHRDNTVAKMYAMRKELESLQAKWESVPWDALRTVLMDMNQTSVEFHDINDWVYANAPKEPTE